MNIPRCTYRLQLRPGFGFADCARVAPYLVALGVSHIYASPIFRARPGSEHGYDVCDPTDLNPELAPEGVPPRRDPVRLHPAPGVPDGPGAFSLPDAGLRALDRACPWPSSWRAFPWHSG